MNRIIWIYSLLLMVLIACTDERTSNQTNNTITTTPDNTSVPAPQEDTSPIPQPAPMLNCTVEGDILEGNQFWLKEEQLLLVIKADSTTLEEGYGESHRILELYNSDNCTLLKRELLPVNVSPDYPYYIAEVLYNKAHLLLGIKGFDAIYCYSLKEQKLIGPMKPSFKTARNSDDAQTGMILRLEVWEDQLIGYAQDQGMFAFDLTNPIQPKSVIPFAEYKSQSEYNPLFLIEEEKGLAQAIMPTYDMDGDKLIINPAFSEPVALSQQATKSAANNRYIVMYESGENRQAYLFDLLKHKRIELPEDKKQLPTQEILNWIKTQKPK